MDPWHDLLASLTKLRDSWPAPPWTWDARFCTVASSFAIELEPAVRTSAVHAFPRGWTLKSLDAAPPALRALCDRTGGLRARQRLLAGDEATAPGLYGLWWPWGSGDKITLRIGIADLGAAADPVPRIRELFGVKV
jgi:hypothetical protein